MCRFHARGLLLCEPMVRRRSFQVVSQPIATQAVDPGPEKGLCVPLVMNTLVFLLPAL